MKLFFKNNDKANSLELATETDIIYMIEQLHVLQFPYLILEDIGRNYIQCMAGDQGFVVEIRLYNEDGTFKHFVVGTKSVSKIWCTVSGEVGPVHVLGHEVLQIADVKNLFVSFFMKSDMEHSYIKRNVTKMFKKSL